MNRSLVLRVLTAIALIGVAVVHFDIAGDYSRLGKHPVSLGDQFYAQGVVAILLALALLVRRHLLVWLATAGFLAVSLAVLVYSRYKAIPVYGLPGGFSESWSTKGAKQAAWFEGGGLLLSLIGSALSYRTYARSS